MTDEPNPFYNLVSYTGLEGANPCNVDNKLELFIQKNGVKEQLSLQ